MLFKWSIITQENKALQQANILSRNKCLLHPCSEHKIINTCDLNFAKYYYFYFAYRKGVFCENSFLTLQGVMYYWNCVRSSLPKATHNNSSRKKKNPGVLLIFKNYLDNIYNKFKHILFCDLIEITYSQTFVIKFELLSNH